MKKRFGIFIIIGIIFFSGVSVTAFTNHYFNARLERVEHLSAQESLYIFSETTYEVINDEEEAFPLSPEMADVIEPRDFSAAEPVLKEVFEEFDQEQVIEEIADYADSAFLLVYEDSVLDVEALNKEEYTERLEDLEEQLKTVWEDDSIVSTADMLKAAEHELAVWDLELNTIYQLLREKLPEEEFEVLKVEERQWIRERDAIASAEAAEYEGGSLQGLTYTMTLIDETRSRTYVLTEYYFQEE